MRTGSPKSTVHSPQSTVRRRQTTDNREVRGLWSVDRRRGVTLVELIIVIAIVAILATAFSTVFAPMINTFFYYPQASRVNTAAADLLKIIIEGDGTAKGLRFAGLPCTIGGAGGGGSTITTASTAGNTSTLTYNYVDADYCGPAAARISKTVTLIYDRSVGTVTRSVDGGTAAVIPYYVGTASDVNFSVSGAGTDIFHYFDSAPADMGAAPVVANIYRVDIDFIASSGTGAAKDNSGQMRLKSGVEIKRYTT